MHQPHLMLLVVGQAPLVVQQRHGSYPDLFLRGLWASAPGLPLVPWDIRAVGADDPVAIPTSLRGVVVTGSAHYLDEDLPFMRVAQRFIRRVVEREIPLLGVCFGHQLLAAALGGTVGKNARGRAAGTCEVVVDHDDDPLFRAMDARGRFSAQVIHRDVVLDPGPQVAVLAHADHDEAHVIRAGTCAWGVQYHPEFDVAVMTTLLNERRPLLDQERGPGATHRYLAGLLPTPQASATLAAFSTLVHQR